MTRSPFSPAIMEAIAAAFALDVPRVALLVLAATAPVQRAVYDLRDLSVNACGLDLLASGQGKEYLLRGRSDIEEESPTLLVSTLATTRGLDLPDLSHVFILGLLEGRGIDAYLHAAGRVGRFGRGGKVISILEERYDAISADGKKVGRDEPGKLTRLLKLAGITLTRFEHFH
jgi:Helicase conserved C-terminal domain